MVWGSSNLRDLSDSGNFTDNFLDGRERMPLRSKLGAGCLFVYRFCVERDYLLSGNYGILIMYVIVALYKN